MSNISTIYDRVRTLVPTLTGFSDKTEIINPVDLVDNDIGILRNGWGLRIGTGITSPFGEFKKYDETREFEIVLTQEVLYLSHNIDPWVTTNKELLEDQDILKKAFLSQDQLDIYLNIQKIDLGNSTGVEYLNLDKQRIAFASVVFLIQIQEQLD